MNNQALHTASPTNSSASLALGKTIGQLTFDQIGSKTFDQIGTNTFDTLYPPLANQPMHTASPSNQSGHSA